MLIYVLIGTSMLFPQPDPFCSIYSKSKNVFYASAVSFNYFALWFKVNQVFYQVPVIEATLNKYVKLLNKMLMPVAVIIIVGVLLHALCVQGNVFAGCGCKYPYISSAHSMIFTIIGTIVFQAVILFCIVYPLYLHNRNLLDLEINYEYIIPVVKRAAKSAGVCIMSDICLSFLFFIYTLHTDFVFSTIGETRYVPYFIYISNLLLNLNAVIASFSNWQERVFPFRESCK